jgi:hypothetical protein
VGALKTIRARRRKMAGIFGKVVDGLNKGVATVGANSKAVLEKTQVKTIMKNLETERKQLADLLGMKVYESYIENKEIVIDESIENFIAEITKRIEGVAEQQAELERIDREVALIAGTDVLSIQEGTPCACGHINASGSNYCEKCGGKIA